MAYDERLMFFKDTSLARTTAAGRTQVGDILYLGHAHNLGPGTPLFATLKFTVAGATANSILLIELEVANEVAFDTTQETTWSSGLQAMATLTKGRKFRIPIANDSKTYLRIMTTATVANLSAAVGDCGIEIGDQDAGEAGAPVTP